MVYDKEEEAIRACLGPGQPRHVFLSRWKGNRICKKCAALINYLDTGFKEIEINIQNGKT